MQSDLQATKAATPILANHLSRLFDFAGLRVSLDAADRPQFFEGVKKLGFPTLLESELALSTAILSRSYATSIVTAEGPSRGTLTAPGSLGDQSVEEVYWRRKSQFRAMHQMDNTPRTACKDAEKRAENADLLLNVESVADAIRIVSEALVKKVSRTSTMSRVNVDPSWPRHAVIVEFLVAVETPNWFVKELDTNIMIFKTLGTRA